MKGDASLLVRRLLHALCMHIYTLKKSLALREGIDDGGEVIRFQAGPADEGAIDIWDCKNLCRIAGFDRTTVKDAEISAVGEPCGKVGANVGVHFGDLIGCGDLAGANGPDRFIGDHGIDCGGRVGN